MSEYNGKDHGITYKDSTWMIGGVISDGTFIDNTGYVGEDGYVHIFYKHPRRAEMIPWFTVDEKGELEFSDHVPEEVKICFKESRVQNMSIVEIAEESKGIDRIYSEEMMNEIMNASSKYIPEIKDKDDFLKKIIKTALIVKDVDAHIYKNLMVHPYQLSNLIQLLQNDTKVNPKTWSDWTNLIGTDYIVILKDNGNDAMHPMGSSVVYDSSRDKISIIKNSEKAIYDFQKGEIEKEEVDEDGNKKVYAKSYKQFKD